MAPPGNQAANREHEPRPKLERLQTTRPKSPPLPSELFEAWSSATAVTTDVTRLKTITFTPRALFFDGSPSQTMTGLASNGRCFKSLRTNQEPSTVFECLSRFVHKHTGGEVTRNANAVVVTFPVRDGIIKYRSFGRVVVAQGNSGTLEITGEVMSQLDMSNAWIWILCLLFVPIIGWIIIGVFFGLSLLEQQGGANPLFQLQAAIDSTEHHLAMLDGTLYGAPPVISR